MKLVEQTVEAYSNLLASDFPTPGGGSTAALNGALGCGFITMIARISLAKPAFAERRALLRHIITHAEMYRKVLLALVDEDTEAYNGIMAARALRNVNSHALMVHTAYSGADSAKVERSVTRPVEAVISSIPGVTKVTSISFYGSSTIAIALTDGTDKIAAASVIQHELTTVWNTMPKGAEIPQVSAFDPVEALRTALHTAVAVPFQIQQGALTAINLARSLSEGYYEGTASDLALAALNLETAARGAFLTVRSNLNHLAAIASIDAEYIQHKARESASLLEHAEHAARSVYAGAKALLSTHG
ncbi:efflux RND transporter permease subunit [Breznakiellaceae bacterium SP9]